MAIKTSSPPASSTPVKSSTPVRAKPPSPPVGSSASAPKDTASVGRDVNEKAGPSKVNFAAWGEAPKPETKGAGMLELESLNLTPHSSAPAPAKPEAKKPDAKSLLEALGKKNLRKGAKGEQVKALQAALNERLGSKLETDGVYGSKTTAAVKSFQNQGELQADGVLGPLSKQALAQ